MVNAVGEAGSGPLRLIFDRSVKVAFQGFSISVRLPRLDNFTNINLTKTAMNRRELLKFVLFTATFNLSILQREEVVIRQGWILLESDC